ncbi:hypothetical protein RYH80_18850 [Halobaculum sp. MBLA0147]|uniref:hypothetical protein n=1 Tax=Halobaculum sp. MBLA0147 TaxID=3079934 RepID=UPI0035246F31
MSSDETELSTTGASTQTPPQPQAASHDTQQATYSYGDVLAGGRLKRVVETADVPISAEELVVTVEGFSLDGGETTVSLSLDEYPDLLAMLTTEPLTRGRLKEVVAAVHTELVAGRQTDETVIPAGELTIGAWSPIPTNLESPPDGVPITNDSPAGAALVAQLEMAAPELFTFRTSDGGIYTALATSVSPARVRAAAVAGDDIAADDLTITGRHIPYLETEAVEE